MLFTDTKIAACYSEHHDYVGIAYTFLSNHLLRLYKASTENADPIVRVDFETAPTLCIPENAPYYKHNYEGSD